METKPVTAGPPSLADRLGTTDNAIGFVRLSLAALVVFGHGLPLGGFTSPVFSGVHGSAVNGFFIVSGYLILASGLRCRPRAFVWRRFLRIYPGYILALVVTAFVLAPLAAFLEPGASWHSASAIRYVLGALDMKPSQDGIDATLLTVPRPGLWNASLWTLFYECLAYAGVLVLVAIPVLRRHRRGLLWVLVAVGGVLNIFPALQEPFGVLPGPLPQIAGNGARLWTFFAIGMLVHEYASRLRPTRGVVSVSLLLWVVTTQLGLGVPFALRTLAELVLLPVIVLGAGALLRTRIGATRDLSYGLYVFACPVQQILLVLGVGQFGWLPTVLSCLLCTMPIAWASWTFIEKPALSLKRLVSAH